MYRASKKIRGNPKKGFGEIPLVSWFQRSEIHFLTGFEAIFLRFWVHFFHGKYSINPTVFLSYFSAYSLVFQRL